MATFRRRFYKGHDNYIRHFFVADSILDDGTVERDEPVKFGSAELVDVTLRDAGSPLEGYVLKPEITFSSLAPPEPETFYRDDLGNLGIRYGDLSEAVVGTVYHARIVVYDLDSPDGLVVCSYGDDATNDTWELLCS